MLQLSSNVIAKTYPLIMLSSILVLVSCLLCDRAPTDGGGGGGRGRSRATYYIILCYIISFYKILYYII